MSHWYSVSKQQILQLHFSDMHPWSVLRVFTDKVHTVKKTDCASDHFLYAQLWLIIHTGQVVHLAAHARTMSSIHLQKWLKLINGFTDFH